MREEEGRCVRFAQRIGSAVDKGDNLVKPGNLSEKLRVFLLTRSKPTDQTHQTMHAHEKSIIQTFVHSEDFGSFHTTPTYSSISPQIGSPPQSFSFDHIYVHSRPFVIS